MAKPVYASNGAGIGDRLTIARVSNGGAKFEILVDPKTERFVEVILKGSVEAQPDDDDEPAPEDDDLPPLDDDLGGEDEQVPPQDDQADTETPPAGEAGEQPGDTGGGASPPPPPVVPPVTAPSIFVAPWGDDANPGTAEAPLRTVRTPLPGQSIGIAPGVYEVSPMTLPAGSTLQGWGGIPELTGGRAVTGVPCTAVDAAEVGAIWPDVWKYRVPLSMLPGGQARSALPSEDGRPLSPAMTRVANPKHPKSEVYVKDWLSGTPVLNGTTIAGYRNPVFASLTHAQVMACTVEFIGSPNQNYQTQVAAFDGTTVTLANQGVVYENSDLKDRFALSNCLPLMERGGWGYRVSGSDAILYVRHHDPANPGFVRVASIGSAIRTGGANVTIRNLKITQTCDVGLKTNGQYPVVATHDDFTAIGVTVENVGRGTSKDYGAFYIKDCKRPTLLDCHVKSARKMFGLLLHGTAPGRVGQPLVEGCTLTDVDNSPIRVFGTDRAIIAFTDWAGCGLEAHSNQVNFYEGCTEALIWDCRSGDTGGYMTWQESLAPCVVLSRIRVSNKSGVAAGRAFADQNRNPLPAASSKGYILSSVFEPNWPDRAKPNSIVIGKDALPVDWEVYDTIYHGAYGSSKLRNMGAGNVSTNKNPLLPGDRQMTPEEVYADPANHNFTLKPIGTGGDRRAQIAQLQAMFPRFTNWNQSRNGTIDWANAPLGCGL
jgi:hypothetical protein